MDYAHRRRVKLWGRARVVVGDAALIAQLTPEGYRARPEQAILFTVEAWDVNCPQHIPQKIDAADVAAALDRLQRRIAELEAENAGLRRAMEGGGAGKGAAAATKGDAEESGTRLDRHSGRSEAI